MFSTRNVVKIKKLLVLVAVLSFLIKKSMYSFSGYGTLKMGPMRTFRGRIEQNRRTYPF